MQNTAILLFANSPHEELGSKPIPDGDLLFSALTLNTLDRIKKTPFPCFHITGEQQKGNSFGERFSNAIQSVFDKGYKKVIAIGNDTPQLQAQHIRQAAKAMVLGKTVIGPSYDGGFYLLGIHKDNFDNEKFTSLPWQQTKLLQAVIDFLLLKGCEVHRLSYFRDIDQVDDIPLLLNFIKSLNSFIRAILCLYVSKRRKISSSILELFTSLYLLFPYNKGSPELVEISIGH